MKKLSTVFVPFICTLATIVLTAEELLQKEENTMQVAYDVCNTNLIYDKANGFEYSLPKNVLQGFLSGKAFDNKEVYTEEEALKLQADINEIFQDILSSNPVKKNLAIITAGAPGAGKTTLLKQDLVGKNYAYICPDDVCLQKQTRTYIGDIEKGDGSNKARQAAYNKWRPGSNAANHLILANLIREKYAFYFGTTSSGPATGKFFEFLKKQGYDLRVIHVTASDKVRWDSIQKRDDTFVQTTEKDVQEKGFLLPQRIMDTFLAYADEIEFYYRDSVDNDAKLAATWTRNAHDFEHLGTLHVTDSRGYEEIKSIHNAATEILKRPDLTWEATVEKNSKCYDCLSR